MARDFLSEIDGSYPIPGSICVMSGNDSLDIRDWCDTVADFQTAATGGFELRRDGLITYEKSTQTLKLCKLIQGTFTWVEIGKGVEVVNNLTTGGIDKALSAEQGKVLWDNISRKSHYYLTLDEWNALPSSDKSNPNKVFFVESPVSRSVIDEAVLIKTSSGKVLQIKASDDGTLFTEAFGGE